MTLLCAALLLVGVRMVVSHKIQDDAVLKQRLEPCKHKRKPSH